jgi:hypothetical protein
MDLVIIINMSVIIHYLSYFTEKENNHSWYFTGPELFPLYPNVLLVCPMSGWLQTYVNKLATAQCGRYVLISFPSN